MKVAITNGWLVFDNELEDESQASFLMRRGRVRLEDVCSYTRLKAFNGWSEADGYQMVTLVFERGRPDAWRVDGDCQELLDGYFGRSA